MNKLTAPGVEPLAAITFKLAVDDTHWVLRSKSVDAHFGITPVKFQSGESDVTGRINHVGDTVIGTAFY